MTELTMAQTIRIKSLEMAFAAMCVNAEGRLLPYDHPHVMVMAEQIAAFIGDGSMPEAVRGTPV